MLRSLTLFFLMMPLVQMSEAQSSDNMVRCPMFAMRGCVGKMTLNPLGTLQKTSQLSRMKTWSIERNRLRDSLITESIELEGDCCWEITSRQNVLELHKPSDTYPKTMTTMPYIHRIKAIKCPGRC